MQKYLKFLLIVLIIASVVPQITLAAWWNPFSWGIWNRIFHFKQQEQKQEQLIGGDKDSHGCLPAAGYSWCEEKQKCLRTWEEKCEKITDPTAGWQTVRDENFGVTIKVPTSWLKLQYPSGMQNTSVGLKKGFQKFEIIKQSLPSGVSFESLLKIWITTQKNVVSSNDTTIDGKAAYKVIRNDSSAVNPKAITIFINGNNKTYQLDWAMGKDYFDNNQNEINQILESIHFTK